MGGPWVLEACSLRGLWGIDLSVISATWFRVWALTLTHTLLLMLYIINLQLIQVATESWAETSAWEVYMGSDTKLTNQSSFSIAVVVVCFRAEDWPQRGKCPSQSHDLTLGSFSEGLAM